MLIDIIELGKVVGAFLTISGVVFAIYKFVRTQILDPIDNSKREIEKLKKEIKTIKENHNDHIESSQKEFSIIIQGLSACLDGLIQLGANSNVTTRKEEIDKFLLDKSHGEN